MNTQALLTDLTPEQEEKVTGGVIPAIIVAAVAKASIAAIASAVGAAFVWGLGNGNGLIINDNKGSSKDGFRWGKGIGGDQDLPNGWSWGIKDGNQWVAGGNRRFG